MRKLIWLAVAILMALTPTAHAQGKLNVVTTTEDLGSLAREVGGDKVAVTALAKGYQDPHFVDPKPSFILAVSRADVLIAVGRELEIGWLPPLLTSGRNAKIQPGGPGYLDASMNVRILELPTGQITRAMGDVHPLGNPHFSLDPGLAPIITQNILEGLARVAPEHRAAFEKNRAATIQAVEAADEELFTRRIRSAGGVVGPLATVFHQIAVAHVLGHAKDIAGGT